MAARPQAACPAHMPSWPGGFVQGTTCASMSGSPATLGSGWCSGWEVSRLSSGRRATLTMGLRLLLPGLLRHSRDCYLWSQHLLFQFTLCPIARVIFVKCKSCVIYLFKVLYRQCFLAWHEALLEIPPGFSPWASFLTPAKKRGFSMQWLRAGTWSPKVPELLEIILALPLADNDLGK